MAKGKHISNTDTAEIPISSMIDVVFLLIIFFVVTAAVDKDVEDEKVILATAPHGRTVTAKDPRAIIINVRQNGEMTMGIGQVVTREQIRQIIENAKSQYGTDFPIIIRGDYNAQHEFIKRAMEGVTDTQLYKVNLNGQKETN